MGIGLNGLWRRGGGVLYCMAGELWASVYGLAIMRSSLATSVPGRTEFATTAVGLDIWNAAANFHRHYPFFFFLWMLHESWSPNWQIWDVHKKKKQFPLPSSHKWISVARGRNKGITFDSVVIKLLYSYSTGWRDNSSLATVRPTSISLVFFLPFSSILFLCLNTLMVFTEHSCTRGRRTNVSPLVTTGLLLPLCLWALVCFFKDCEKICRVRAVGGESSHVSCDTSIGKSKRG